MALNRVLFLAPQPFFSNRGTTIAELETIRALAGRGHHIDLLTYSDGEDVVIPGCTIHRIRRIPFVRRIRPGFSATKLLSDAIMLVHAGRLARRYRYHVVHAVEESVFIALALKWVYGIPYVYDMDSSLPTQLTDQLPALRPLMPLFRRLERLTVRRSVAVLTMCGALEELAREQAKPGALVGRVEDMAMTDGEVGVDRLADHTGGGPTVLYVGNLMAYQGVDLLLDAFGRALADVPDAHLVIIGGSEERRRHFQDMTAGSQMASRVHLIGPRPLEQLGWYLRQATILASPRTKGSNTPMKLYSYLDSGVPVLATRLATHTQVVDDSQAMLCEPEPAAMAEGMIRLLEDAELRERLATNAKELVAREFTPEAHRRKLDRFYDAVELALGSGAGGPGRRSVAAAKA